MELTGIYQKTIYRNEQNGYTVFIFDTTDADAPRNEKGEVICVGDKMQIYVKGMPLKVTGTPSTHNGDPILRVTDIRPYSDNRANTIKYLTGHRFTGIGEKTAEAIVEAIGTDIFVILDKDDPAEFLKTVLPNIKEDKRNTLLQVLKQDRNNKEIYAYVQRFGGTFDQANKLASLFTSTALDNLKEHPYRCGQKAGFNFAICDAIARENGSNAYNEERIEAMVVLALRRIMANGCSYANIDDINEEVHTLIHLSIFHEELPQSLIIRALYNSSQIVIEEGNPTKFYLKPIYNAEQQIVENIKRLHAGKVPFEFDEEYIQMIERMNDIKYSAQQKSAFNFLTSSGIKILTGGPGTGKTTVVNGLIQAFRHFHPDETVTLCAPTGRAAARMNEVTGEPASTIHRLLEVTPLPNGEYMCKDGKNQLGCQMLIVDEISMVDEELFAMLLAAVKTDTLVILCGDKDQLPSVGAGNVLHDLINTKNCPIVQLNVMYRQNKESHIAINAGKVNNGIHDLQQGTDFEIITADNDEQMVNILLSHLKNNPVKSTDITETQILSSTKKGLAGTVSLNNTLQKYFNPKHDAQIAYGTTEYRVGDKVMFIKNNYEYNYMNGDVGIIRSINEDGTITVQVANEGISIPYSNLTDLALSYAATIHKSQGSEYDIVYVMLPKAPQNMLQRNLIYTAITRAKKKVIIITQSNAIDIAIDNIVVPTRKTMLVEKLRGYRPKPIRRRITNE